MYVLSTPLWPLGGEGQVRLFRMTRSMEEVMKFSFASTDYLDSRWDLHIYKGLRCTVYGWVAGNVWTMDLQNVEVVFLKHRWDRRKVFLS